MGYDVMLETLKFLTTNSKAIKTRLQNRLNPILVWKGLSQKTLNLGISKSFLTLSFDCDTAEDGKVVLEVHKRLLDLGVTSVYAVPGRILQQNLDQYWKLREFGAQFINHGGHSHTYFDEGTQRYKSNFFYDQLEPSVIEEDIFLGHEILKKEMGIEAKGWRTPHFGTFNQPQHFYTLYKILLKLKYLYSTSSVPMQAYKYGPVFYTKGLYEIPVTGSFSSPLSIMDSWGFFEAPDRVKTPHDYVADCELFANFLARRPLILNLYADPSHIYNQPMFFEGISLLMRYCKSINLDQLVGMLHDKNDWSNGA